MFSTQMFRPALVAAFLFLVAALPSLEARAAFIALGRTDTSPNNPPQGGQNFGGSLGEDFQVGSQAIFVTQLGVFDSGGATIPSGNPISVEIFDNFGAHPLVVAPVAISSSSPGVSALTDGYLYVPIAQVALLANHSYRLVAFGFNGTNHNGNINSFDATPVGDVSASGLISFPSTGTGFNGPFSAPTNSYYDAVNAPGSYPTTADATSNAYVANLYSAGSFQFVPVPEPGSVVLLGLGALGLIAFARRRAR